MLRIITLAAEAKTEQRRIGDRHDRPTDRARDFEILSQEQIVAEILQTVKLTGDQALLDYTTRFDRFSITLEQLRISGSEIDAAYQQVSKKLIDAISLAASQIEAFHQQRLPRSWVEFGEDDVVLGKRYTPVDKAGLYIRGGGVTGTIAPTPSLVLMNALPAKVAQVKRIVMVTPPGPEGKINPALLVAAVEAGVEEIYRVGGAQAIAALAYGTQTIPKVDIITGYGDIYVNLAKKLVYPTVGIDSVALSSEVIIIADRSANPVCVAADLLATAEHDPISAAILLTTETQLATKVQAQVRQQLDSHPRKTNTEKAIANYGIIVIVGCLTEAAELANLFAPSHLQLCVEEPWELLEHIRHAGAIFLGNYTPEAVGNYLAGTGETGITNGAARYASATRVETFMKYSSLIQYSPTALKKVASALETLADAEGLPSNADSVRFRGIS